MMGADAPIPPLKILAADQKERPAAASISVLWKLWLWRNPFGNTSVEFVMVTPSLPKEEEAACGGDPP